MAGMHVTQFGDSQKVIDDIHAALSDRLAVSSLEPCPVEFTAAFVGMCKAQSCGKCTPCRIGLSQLERLINQVLDGEADETTLKLIERTARNTYLTADCAIGYETAALVLRALIGFRDDFEYHIAHNACGFDQTKRLPCVSSCPAGVDIPGYLALVAAGRNTDAVRLIRKDNPLPVACGLICEHPCEIHCRRGMVDDALNIRGLKRFATDHMESDYEPNKAPATGKRVAVIGGGPAGLSAAYYLALMGHSPVIFDSRKHLGGMMRYGIPSYRLPRQRLEEEIAWLVDKGIELRLETNVGKDITFKQLRDEFDATFIAIGAHADRKLNLPGEDAEGVISAVEMLRSIGDDEIPDYSGKRVAIVGGGNVAMDCARSSVRAGAKSVDIVYRRRVEDMTAQDEEIQGALEEGCNLRQLYAPLEILTKDGKVAGLSVQRQIIGEKNRGRFAPRDADCAPETLECDLVIIAIGQQSDSEAFAAEGVPVNRGRIVTDARECVEGYEDVFAGGDCVSGPVTVIRAIEAGKVAAHNIDEFLGFNHTIKLDVEIPSASLKNHSYCARSNPDEKTASERKDNFELMEQGFTEEEAIQEASRCLRCDHFGFGAFRGGRIEQW